MRGTVHCDLVASNMLSYVNGFDHVRVSGALPDELRGVESRTF
jgi:hypothetical protein